MTEQDVLDLINAWIVANGNNEITADVLRPILVAILQQPNDLIGNLTTLNTTDQSNLVSAINEIYNLVNNNSGIKLHEGLEDPNDTPPTTYNIADFYIQKDIFNNPILLWQYNGINWISTSSSEFTLTTLNNEGAADLIDGVLNIPRYDNFTKGTNIILVDGADLECPNAFNYYENQSTADEVFTVPLITGNEGKIILFVNKSNFLATLTSNIEPDEIWDKADVLNMILQPKEAVMMRNDGVRWTVISKYQDVYTKNEVDSILDYLLKPQIEVSGNHTVDASWNGKEVTFTGSGTLTIPNTLSDQFNFTLYAEVGVTIAWAIASPYTWRVAGLTVGTAPASMTAGQFCQISRRIGTNEIKVLGL